MSRDFVTKFLIWAFLGTVAWVCFPPRNFTHD